jgi:hypothetical protein
MVADLNTLRVMDHYPVFASGRARHVNEAEQRLGCADQVMVLGRSGG